VVRVRVGEEDGVNLLRAYAEQRQIGDKRTADAIDSPVPVSTSTVCPRPRIR
jgi:hypothetical protein